MQWYQQKRLKIWGNEIQLLGKILIKILRKSLITNNQSGIIDAGGSEPMIVMAYDRLVAVADFLRMKYNRLLTDVFEI